MTRREAWEVVLLVDGEHRVTCEVVDDDCMRQAAAEVRAIRAAEDAGGQDVRCLRSRFMGYVPPVLKEAP